MNILSLLFARMCVKRFILLWNNSFWHSKFFLPLLKRIPVKESQLLKWNKRNFNYSNFITGETKWAGTFHFLLELYRQPSRIKPSLKLPLYMKNKNYFIPIYTNIILYRKYFFPVFEELQFIHRIGLRALVPIEKEVCQITRYLFHLHTTLYLSHTISSKKRIDNSRRFIVWIFHSRSLEVITTVSTFFSPLAAWFFNFSFDFHSCAGRWY